MYKHRYAIIVIVCALLAACGVPPIDGKTKSDEDKAMQRSRGRMQNSTITPVNPNVVETNKVIIPVTQVAASTKSQHVWLQERRVVLTVDRPLAMSEIVRMFYKQGINITSTLPLEGYTYAGNGVNNTDAETALKIILGAVGLDYDVDSIRKIVLIKPMDSKTWYLNVGNRSSTFTSGSNASSGGQAAVSGQAGGNASAISGAMQSGGGNSGTAISSSDNFWSALKSELTSRLTILVPNQSSNGGGAREIRAVVADNPPTPVNASPTPAASSGNSSALYVSKQVGSFSLNPETGAVYVQAPHWILEGLGTYFTRIQEMYNTDILFTCELVMLTRDSGQTEGLDISSFGRFANSKYGFGIKNNSLGGITVSVPDSGAPSITAGNSSLGSTLIGVTNLTTGFQLFNAYLSNHGTVTVVQKPVVGTTSGVPAQISNIVTRYFNSVTQQATSANVGGATTATQNTLVPVDLGVDLKINPRIDVSTGLIRAQISLVQTLNSGTQIVTQSLTVGNTQRDMEVPIPIVNKMSYSGEVLLQDGDLIIVGGQQEDATSTKSNGVTGLKDTIAGGLFGSKDLNRRASTYYFALRVTTHKRSIN